VLLLEESLELWRDMLTLRSTDNDGGPTAPPCELRANLGDGTGLLLQLRSCSCRSNQTRLPRTSADARSRRTSPRNWSTAWWSPASCQTVSSRDIADNCSRSATHHQTHSSAVLAPVGKQLVMLRCIHIDTGPSTSTGFSTWSGLERVALSYRTRIIMNGCCWNTCKLLYTTNRTRACINCEPIIIVHSLTFVLALVLEVKSLLTSLKTTARLRYEQKYE